MLRDYDTLPVLFVRIHSLSQVAARLRADPSVVGIGADRRDEAFLTQSLPLIGQPAAATAGFTGAAAPRSPSSTLGSTPSGQRPGAVRRGDSCDVGPGGGTDSSC